MAETRVRQLSRSIVFRGRVFNIERDRLQLPGGRATTVEIVRHRGSVVLIPQPDRQHVILIRQYRHAIGRWIWELPAGSLEPSESPVHAARRECAEEVGFIPRRIDRLAAYYPTPGFCDERMIFYRCRELRAPARPIAGDWDEQIRPQTFSIVDARQLIRRGLVVDMKTVVGLWLVDAKRPRL